MREVIKKVSYGLSSLMLAGYVYAVPPATEDVDLSPVGNFARLKDITIPTMVPVLIRVILIVAALVALIFLIIGGIKWITSGGDKAAVESARGTITSALIGLLIVFAAWAIIRLIELFFGISILNLKIESIPETKYVP